MNGFNEEFFVAIAMLEKEKGIPQDYMLEKIRTALLTAYRRNLNKGDADGRPDPNASRSESIPVLRNGEDSVVINIDKEKKVITMSSRVQVVEDDDIQDPVVDITLTEARRISPHAQVGDVIERPVETKQFGRIAAQSAKQVIIQGIREAERGMIFDEFTSKEHEVLTGTVSRIDPRTGAVSIRISSNSEYTEAVLPAQERIRTEEIHEGDRLKVYVVEVRKQTYGPQVIISRTHPGLVKRLFELEVPEIFDGTVEIRSIAREAGSRTKMAVLSSDPNVDPIGACVGPKGDRVGRVVDELGGEKIDIIKFSEDPEQYIASALSPAEVLSVELIEGEKNSCRVTVPDSQLSLAIGKEGQNARLAAKLTGYKIDIKPAGGV
jgi:N utilization substance protein A